MKNITFSNVNFKYSKRLISLKILTFLWIVRKTAIAGLSGAGKKFYFRFISRTIWAKVVERY